MKNMKPLMLQADLQECLYCHKLTDTSQTKSLVEQIAKNNHLKVLTYKTVKLHNKKCVKLVLRGPRDNMDHLYSDSTWQNYMIKYKAILDTTIPKGKLIKTNSNNV